MARYWPLQAPPRTRPATASARTPTASAAAREMPPTAIKYRAARRKPAAALAIAPGSAAPAAEATTVSLDDDDSNRRRAQSLLDETGTKLTSINRSRLTPENAAAYDQARGLVNAGRDAMREQDYLAAAGLAEKASVISRQLATRSPMR